MTWGVWWWRACDDGCVVGCVVAVGVMWVCGGGSDVVAVGVMWVCGGESDVGHVMQSWQIIR